MIIYFVLFSVLICACLAQRTYVLGDSLTVGMKSRLSLLIGADLAGYEATVGDTTSAATSKCSFGPAVTKAVVGLGTNDFWQSVSSFEGYVRALIRKMRAINPNVEIFWTNVYAPRSDVAQGATRLNPVLDTIAQQDSLFHVIDWKSEALARGYAFAGDQLHPTQYCQRADFVWTQVNLLAVSGGNADLSRFSSCSGGSSNSNTGGGNSNYATTACSFGVRTGHCSKQNECGSGQSWVSSQEGAVNCEPFDSTIRCCVSAVAAPDPDPDPNPTTTVASPPQPRAYKTCVAPTDGISRGVCMSQQDCTNGGFGYGASSACGSSNVCCARVRCAPPSGRSASGVMQCADKSFCQQTGGSAYPSSTTYRNPCSKIRSSAIQCCVFPNDFVSMIGGQTASFLEDSPEILDDASVATSLHSSLLALTCMPIVTMML